MAGSKDDKYRPLGPIELDNRQVASAIAATIDDMPSALEARRAGRQGSSGEAPAATTQPELIVDSKPPGSPSQSCGEGSAMDGQLSLPAIEVAARIPPNWERYQILGMLGKGGMGAVYKARDRRLGRVVALKFILGDDPRLTERLLQEARAQARIEHENICKVHEVGEVNGQAYIAMQLINGQSLAVVHRQMSRDDKVLIIATVAEAMHAAHRQGIIHRDRSHKPKICLHKGPSALHHRRTDDVFLHLGIKTVSRTL